MDDKPSIKELNVIYSELFPMFQSVLYQSSVAPGIAEIVANPERVVAQQKRDQQDKEDKMKIRSSLW